jgi:hypothetical protein
MDSSGQTYFTLKETSVEEDMERYLKAAKEDKDRAVLELLGKLEDEDERREKEASAQQEPAAIQTQD